MCFANLKGRLILSPKSSRTIDRSHELVHKIPQEGVGHRNHQRHGPCHHVHIFSPEKMAMVSIVFLHLKVFSYFFPSFLGDGASKNLTTPPSRPSFQVAALGQRRAHPHHQPLGRAAMDAAPPRSRRCTWDILGLLGPGQDFPTFFVVLWFPELGVPP